MTDDKNNSPELFAYRVYQRLGQVFLGYGGSVLGSSYNILGNDRDAQKIVANIKNQSKMIQKKLTSTFA